MNRTSFEMFDSIVKGMINSSNKFNLKENYMDCEMANCTNPTGDYTIADQHYIYAPALNRELIVCGDCKDEFEKMMAYGRPDYAQRWLDYSSELVLEEV